MRPVRLRTMLWARALGALGHHDHDASGLVANPADRVSRFDVGAGDSTAPRVLEAIAYACGGFLNRAVCRGLMQGVGAFLPLFSTRRIFCCGVGWPASRLATEAGCGRRIFGWAALRQFNLPGAIRSRISAWPGLSIEASVSKAVPVWPGSWLALPEVPAAQAVGVRLGLTLAGGAEDRIPDDEADDDDHGDCADEQRQFGAPAQRLSLVLVIVVDRVEGSLRTVRCWPCRLRGRIAVDSSSTPRVRGGVEVMGRKVSSVGGSGREPVPRARPGKTSRWYASRLDTAALDNPHPRWEARSAFHCCDQALAAVSAWRARYRVR